MSIIPGLGGMNSVLQPLGINLEKEALKQFGDFVDDKNRIQAYKDMGLSDEDAYFLNQQARLGEFNVRAASMAHNVIPPKQKFLFEVGFVLSPQIYEKFSTIVNEGVLANFGFFIKQIDRPKVEYTYEDVNMYNFRTRVLTKVTHQPLNMWLWDDARNTVGEFFNLYRMAHSPMARQEKLIGQPGQTGFNFNSEMFGGARDYSSRQALPGNAVTFLDSLRVKQIYSTHQTGSGNEKPFSMTEYVFLNPTIRRFDFDDVNHENGESNGVQVEFDYDGLYIEDYYVDKIVPHDTIKDYYHFVKGERILDNLTQFHAGAQANAGFNAKPSLNLLDEARRALMSGNPLSYVKERGMETVRGGAGSIFGGISSGVSKTISQRSNPKPFSDLGDSGFI